MCPWVDPRTAPARDAADTASATSLRVDLTVVAVLRAPRTQGCARLTTGQRLVLVPARAPAHHESMSADFSHRGFPISIFIRRKSDMWEVTIAIYSPEDLVHE